MTQTPGPKKRMTSNPKWAAQMSGAHHRTTITTAPPSPPRHVRLAEFQRLCVNMLIKVIKRNNL